MEITKDDPVYRIVYLRPDESVVPLPTPTAEQLLRHERKFMPMTSNPGQSLTTLKTMHREAVHKTAVELGIELDQAGTVRRLDQEGKSVAEIEKTTAIPKKRVLQLLRNVAKAPL